MERLIKLFFVAAGVFSSTAAFSQWRVVIDGKAVIQVIENTAMQMAAELSHNAYLDSTLNKQNEIMGMTTAIAASKELNMTTLQNTNGFGDDSMFYKDIERTAKDIASITPELFSSIKNSKWTNKATFTKRAVDLGFKCAQYVNNYINIVNNGKAVNPLQGTSFAENIVSTTDGANILDRKERLDLARQISYDLKKILQELQQMQFLCTYGDWTEMVREIDRESWNSVNEGKAISERLIKEWNNTRK